MSKTYKTKDDKFGTEYQILREMLPVNIDEFLDISTDLEKRMFLGETYEGLIRVEDILRIKETTPKILLTDVPYVNDSTEAERVAIQKIRDEWIYAYTRTFPHIILNDAKDNAINIGTSVAFQLLKMLGLIDKMFAIKIHKTKEKYDFPIL